MGAVRGEVAGSMVAEVGWGCSSRGVLQALSLAQDSLQAVS